eukprot:gene182-48_t
MPDDKYVFLAEWYDARAELVKKFQFTYYVKDSTVQMYDLKTNRVFLKRSECPGVSVDKLFLGSILSVHARQLKLVDYADVFTRKAFEEQKSRTLALIKPDAYNNLGKIISIIQQAGLRVTNLQMLKMTPEFAAGQYAEHKGKPFYDKLIDFMVSDVCVAMELVGKNAVATWRGLMGPTDVEKAKREEPNSLRAQFGTDQTRNAVHGSDSSMSASRELALFFGRQLPTTAIFNNCTLCIVKPHAMDSMGEVVDRILQEGYEISAMKIWNLATPLVEEFLEVYRG